MEYLPGICAGISQTISGHPFDTIKTLIQNKQPWRGIGIRGYYRGALPPLFGGMLFNGLLFPTYHTINPYVNNQYWLSGAITGIIITPTIFTLETIKIIKQTKVPLTREAFFRTTGLETTFLREAMAMSINLSVYEYCKEQGWSPFAAGATGGLANWTATYPLDVIRTRQVAQQIAFKKAYQQGQLYRGLGIVMARSMLVNGIIFNTYETVNNLVKQQQARTQT